MHLQRIIVGKLRVNAIVLKKNDKAIIIDAGDEEDKIINFLETNNLTPILLMNTHAHFDHIGSVEALKSKYGINFLLHKEDEELMKRANEHLALYFEGNAMITIPKKIDDYLKDEQIIDFEGEKIKVLHTPGHTKGSVCFYIPSIKSVITGDTLFNKAIGRSDFEGGNIKTLENSIKSKLLTLPEETIVVSGHGIDTTIGAAKVFLQDFF